MVIHFETVPYFMIFCRDFSKSMARILIGGNRSTKSIFPLHVIAQNTIAKKLSWLFFVYGQSLLVESYQFITGFVMRTVEEKSILDMKRIQKFKNFTRATVIIGVKNGVDLQNV